MKKRVISALLLSLTAVFAVSAFSGCGILNDILNGLIESLPPAPTEDDREEEIPEESGCRHVYGEWELVSESCTSRSEERTCGLCGNVEEKTQTGNFHKYGEWQTEVATCTQIKQYAECSECGDVIYQTVDGAGHSYVGGVCEICHENVLDVYNGTYGYDYFVDNGYSAQAQLYMRIDEVAREFHSGLADATVKDDYYVVSQINYNDLGLSSNEAVSVWKTYRDDNPLYYWISSLVSYTPLQLYFLTDEEYAVGTVRAQINSALYAKIAEISAGCKSDSAYEKTKYFHDTIIKMIDYAYDESNQPSMGAQAHNILGVFEETGAVCEGYAKAFQLLLNYNGIENIIISGTANGGGHAWNGVNIEGKWYLCDVTWDDAPNTPLGIIYNYFLVGTEDAVTAVGGKKTFNDLHTANLPTDEAVSFLYGLPEFEKRGYGK